MEISPPAFHCIRKFWKVMMVRYSKMILVLCMGLFGFLVAWNNIADYGSNFAFVQHVMTMDTTFAGNALMGRAITDDRLHRAAYAMIILAEALTGLLCTAGAYRLWRARKAGATVFNAAKGTAVAGLTLGFTTWFFGFMTVGAEWFLMWQSPTWNGQPAAFRFIVCLGIVLLYLATRDEEVA